MLQRRFMITCATMLFAATALAQDCTIFVDDDASPGGDGLAWATAFDDLQDALANACPGEAEIRIAQGVYLPGSARDDAFVLVPGWHVIGGYAGIGAADPDDRDPKLYETILSGNIGDLGTNVDNAYHVVRVDGVFTVTAISGVTIADGFADGSGDRDDGGGLFGEFGTGMDIESCVFRNNIAEIGGAVYLSSGNASSFVGCEFYANHATRRGGGAISVTGSQPVVIANSIFVGNSANTEGGAVRLRGLGKSLINCTFVQNSAGSTGSAIFSASEPIDLIANSIFRDQDPPFEPINPFDLLVEHSNIQHGFAGTGNIDADPVFVSLPDPGPDGTWDGVDDDFGDLRLAIESPSVESGENSHVPPGVTDDIAGLARIEGCNVDMGAYEYPAPAPTDCNNNTTEDFCEARADCNDNATLDLCDIESATSDDCNADGVPDECEPDCNSNTVADECDITLGTSEDCNLDGIPDECQPNGDCNNNGEPDLCDIGTSTSGDCNTNAIPDECDIAQATSQDGNEDGIPDECCIKLSTPLPDMHPSGGVITKNRFLSFEVTAAVPVAVRVKAVDLPAPFDILNGSHYWVEEPFTVCENSGQVSVNNPGGCTEPAGPTPLTTTVAELGCGPVCLDLSSRGLVHAYDQLVVADAQYEIQVLHCACDPGDESKYSDPLASPTTTWGDATAGCTTFPCDIADGQIDIPVDVTAILDKFKNNAQGLTKARAELEPSIPDFSIAISDVTFCLDAFQGDPYPFGLDAAAICPGD